MQIIDKVLSCGNSKRHHGSAFPDHGDMGESLCAADFVCVCASEHRNGKSTSVSFGVLVRHHQWETDNRLSLLWCSPLCSYHREADIKALQACCSLTVLHGQTQEQSGEKTKLLVEVLQISKMENRWRPTCVIPHEAKMCSLWHNAQSHCRSPVFSLQIHHLQLLPFSTSLSFIQVGSRSRSELNTDQSWRDRSGFVFVWKEPSARWETEEVLSMFSETEAKNKSDGNNSGMEPAEDTKENVNHKLFNPVIHYNLKNLCHIDVLPSFTAKLELKNKCKHSVQNMMYY